MMKKKDFLTIIGIIIIITIFNVGIGSLLAWGFVIGLEIKRMVGEKHGTNNIKYK